MPFPIPHMAAVKVNKWIVVMAGITKKNNKNDVNKDIYVFDSETYQWDQFDGTTMNAVQLDFAAAVLEGDNIFTIGGINEKGNIIDSIEFSTFADLSGITNVPSSTLSSKPRSLPSRKSSTTTGIGVGAAFFSAMLILAIVIYRRKNFFNNNKEIK